MKAERRPHHRTTVNLPDDLLRAARAETGARSATEAITLALEELVRRRKLERLLKMETPDLTPDKLDRLRRWRTFGD